MFMTSEQLSQLLISVSFHHASIIKDRWMTPQEQAFQELQPAVKPRNQLPWCQQSGIYPLRQAQRRAADRSWRWDPGSRAAQWGNSCRRSRRWILEGTGTWRGSSGRSLEQSRGQCGQGHGFHFRYGCSHSINASLFRAWQYGQYLWPCTSISILWHYCRDNCCCEIINRRDFW